MGDAIQVWDESKFDQEPEVEWLDERPHLTLALDTATNGKGCDRRSWGSTRTYYMAETVEKHTRYSTLVDDLPAAWEFVMKKIDLLGPDPAIEILPSWTLGRDDVGEPPVRQFSVIVSGVTEDEEG